MLSKQELKRFRIENFKLKSGGIENLNLSINILKEGKLEEDYENIKLQNTIEPNLLEEDKAVSLDMEESLQQSISRALQSLENQDEILSKKAFYLYLGSY